jgi:hypothetical protein
MELFSELDSAISLTFLARFDTMTSSTGSAPSAWPRG